MIKRNNSWSSGTKPCPNKSFVLAAFIPTPSPGDHSTLGHAAKLPGVASAIAFPSARRLRSGVQSTFSPENSENFSSQPHAISHFSRFYFFHVKNRSLPSATLCSLSAQPLPDSDVHSVHSVHGYSHATARLVISQLSPAIIAAFYMGQCGSHSIFDPTIQIPLRISENLLRTIENSQSIEKTFAAHQPLAAKNH
jgi:hypothetical protein